MGDCEDPLYIHVLEHCDMRDEVKAGAAYVCGLKQMMRGRYHLPDRAVDSLGSHMTMMTPCVHSGIKPRCIIPLMNEASLHR